jgi:hypothetical protein
MGQKSLSTISFSKFLPRDRFQRCQRLIFLGEFAAVSFTRFSPLSMRLPGPQCGGSGADADEFLEQLDHFGLAGFTARKRQVSTIGLWSFGIFSSGPRADGRAVSYS